MLLFDGLAEDFLYELSSRWNQGDESTLSDDARIMMLANLQMLVTACSGSTWVSDNAEMEVKSESTVSGLLSAFSVGTEHRKKKLGGPPPQPMELKAFCKYRLISLAEKMKERIGTTAKSGTEFENCDIVRDVSNDGNQDSDNTGESDGHHDPNDDNNSDGVAANSNHQSQDGDNLDNVGMQVAINALARSLNTSVSELESLQDTNF